MKTLKVVLVGCGRVARRHAEILGEKQIHGATLAAVCDINSERAKEFGEKYELPWFTDMDEMMSAVDCDIVSVLT